MVYVQYVEDSHMLTFDGPVTFGEVDPKILTSSNLGDVEDSWELKMLPDKEIEWPAYRRNAIDALQRIERYTIKTHADHRILDFGSAWGFFLSVAKERGWVTFGLEPLPATAVYARATFDLNIVTDTLRVDTFPTDFFDVITAFQVFEHLPYPREDLQNLHSTLQRDGIIFIEIPDFDTWSLRIMKSRHRHFVRDHINFFSGETLGKLLAICGFQVIDQYHPTRHMSFRHLVKYWFRRYLPKIVADGIQSSIQRTGLWEQAIGINIRDITTIIARKLD
jgi:SAM-dependent methyltransferase